MSVKKKVVIKAKRIHAAPSKRMMDTIEAAAYTHFEPQTLIRKRSLGGGPDQVNTRRLTNLGMLRAYVFNYLKSHPKIHQSRTLLVRHLAPTPDGLPLEIYVFTNDTDWGVFESVQADIFDHIISLIPEFGLRLFQHPSGEDFAGILTRPTASGG